MTLDALNLYAVPNGYLLASTIEMSINDALYNYPNKYNNSYTARSMISVVRVAQIKMQNMTFSSNWLLETTYDT